MMHENNPAINELHKAVTSLLGDIKYQVTSGDEHLGIVYAKNSISALRLAVLQYGLGCDVYKYHDDMD